jgi:polyribonucleotide nucleotidyltransferase
VKVASADGEAMKAAIKWIKSIASDPEVGQIYEGTVVKVMEFGAFVNFFSAIQRSPGAAKRSTTCSHPRLRD